MATERRAAKRTRNAAKRAGAKFEIDIAAWLREFFGDPRIDRQPKNGNKDLGDIGGLVARGTALVLECKNTSSVNLTGAMREAQVEASNLQADGRYGDRPPIPVVLHKRHGVGAPEKQWATLEIGEFARLVELTNS